MSIIVAASLGDALAALDADHELRPIAGGVGVMLARALRSPTSDRFVAIGGLRELRESPTSSADTAEIGAAVTLEEVAGGPGPPRGVLEAAARATANPGIRAVATIGGNVVAGGAASDPVAALVASRAEAEVVAPGATRRATVASLVAVGLRPGELIRAFRVRNAPLWGWRRVTIRGEMDRSVASVAVVAGPQPGVAVTFAADSVLRLRSVERLLVHGRPDSGEVRRAAARELDRFELRSDDRASDGYRRRIVPILVERAVADALGHTGRPDG